MDCFNKEIAYLHQIGCKGAGVKIGHLDSGIEGVHPAFSGKIAAFRRFGYRGIAEEALSVFDSGWHGTHTAGLIVGQPTQDHHIGIAPAAQLYSGMVIEEGNIIARILAGLDWLIGCEVQVVNLSIGIPIHTPIFKTLVQEMAKRDILLVCPIGNRGAGKSVTPAYYTEVLSVGGADIDGRVATFSGSYHKDNTIKCDKPDLIAPAVDILSTMPNGKYEVKTGTSMASAQVTGVVSLLKGAYPNISVFSIKQALIQSCGSISSEQAHRSANGLLRPLQAYKLLQERQNNTYDIPIPSILSDSTKPCLPYVDTRLQMQMNRTKAKDLCEAIFEFKNWQAVEEFVELTKICNRNEKKSSIKILKHAPIVICQAPQFLINQVLQMSSIVVASACDIDRFV